MRTEIFRGKDGDWWWHEKAANGQIVASSGEGYKTRWGARLAASKFAREPEHSKLPLLLALIAVVLLALLAWWLVSSYAGSTDPQPSTHTSQPTPVQPTTPPPHESTPTPTELPNTGSGK